MIEYLIEISTFENFTRSEKVMYFEQTYSVLCRFGPSFVLLFETYKLQSTKSQKQVCCKMSTALMQVDFQHFLSTSLMQVVSTTCGRSVNIKLHQGLLVQSIALVQSGALLGRGGGRSPVCMGRGKGDFLSGRRRKGHLETLD